MKISDDIINKFAEAYFVVVVFVWIEETLQHYSKNCLRTAAVEGKSFVLMPPRADNVLSKDYQIHIKKLN